MAQLSDLALLAHRLRVISANLSIEVESGADFDLCHKLADEAEAIAEALEDVFFTLKGNVTEELLTFRNDHVPSLAAA